MSQLVTTFVVLAVILAAIGIQALTRWIHSAPVDVEPPTPLIQRQLVSTTLPPPMSLSRTEQLVHDSAASAPMARRRLWPLVVSLGRMTGTPAAELQPPSGDTQRWLAQTLDILERDDQP